MGKKKKKKENIRIENEWNNFRNSVYETKSKSQDDFEKYINVIASGGIALTIAFFDKIVKIETAGNIWIIIIGWILLVITLLSNLISHYLTIQYAEKTINEINDKLYDSIFDNVKIRNKKTTILNIISIVALFTGIASIITFIIFNI